MNTLRDPDTIAVDASEHRTTLAQRAGVLSMALDTATSARANSSHEKILNHQMAAAHKAGMEMLIRLENSLATRPPVEAARVTNAAVRLFEVCQSGCLVLQKLKTGGRQHVVVQHQQVNVSQGGKAIVAGKITRGSRGRGSSRK